MLLCIWYTGFWNFSSIGWYDCALIVFFELAYHVTIINCFQVTKSLWTGNIRSLWHHRVTVHCYSVNVDCSLTSSFIFLHDGSVRKLRWFCYTRISMFPEVGLWPTLRLSETKLTTQANFPGDQLHRITLYILFWLWLVECDLQNSNQPRRNV